MPSDDAIVSRKDISEIFCVNYQTVYLWERRGRIPPGTRYGRRLLRWRFGDIRAALEAA